MKSFIALITLTLSLDVVFGLPIDSIKTKDINGKKYIVYKINDGETITSISKHYAIEIPTLLAMNTHIKSKDDIKKNDILNIPLFEVNEEILEENRIYKSSSEIPLLEDEDDYVMHKVISGDNLTQIAKKNNTSVEQLKQWNRLPDDKIKLGQELIVGIGNRKSTQKNNTSNSTYANKTYKSGIGGDQTKIHVVESKETLFKISADYSISIEDLIQWNELKNDVITAGQKLYVSNPYEQTKITENKSNNPATKEYDVIKHKVAPKEFLNAIAKEYNVTTAQIQEWNNITDPNLIKIGQELIIRVPVKNITVPQNKILGINNSTQNKTPLENNSGKNTIPVTAQGNNTNQQSVQNLDTFHIVQSGETMQTVADLFKVKLNDLVSWNKAKYPNPDKLRAHKDTLLILKSKIGSVPAKTQTTGTTTTGNNQQNVQPNPNNDPMLNLHNDIKTNTNPVNNSQNGTNTKSTDPISNIYNSTSNNNPNRGTDNPSTTVKDTTKNKPSNTTVPKDTIKIIQATSTDVNVHGSNIKKESGNALIIEKSEKSNKNLCMHKTAIAGTNIEIKNPINGQVAIARVSGTLPDDASNKNVVIRISDSVFQLLNPGGDKTKPLPIELSYTIK